MSGEGGQIRERDELVLHAYHDGELSGFARWRFARRLAHSTELQRALTRLEQLADWTREEDGRRATPDLWPAIALRLPALDAQAAEAQASPTLGSLFSAYYRPAAAVAATAALAFALVLGIIGESPPSPGVITWLDTGGRSVLVLEDGDDATIVWLLEGPVEGARRGGLSEAV